MRYKNSDKRNNKTYRYSCLRTLLKMQHNADYHHRYDSTHDAVNDINSQMSQYKIDSDIMQVKFCFQQTYRKKRKYGI